MASGGKVKEMGHFPFGESWYNATSDKLFFTTYERDSESGNDYAMARYHISRLGRLSSPDPLNGSTTDPHDPDPDSGGGGGVAAARRLAANMLKDPNCRKFLQETMDAIAPGHTMAQFSAGMQQEQVHLSLVPYSGPGGTQAAAAAKPPHSVTLYPLFNTLSPAEQGDTFIHEEFHLAPFNFSDQQLAASIFPNFSSLTTADASSTFNEFLLANCK